MKLATNIYKQKEYDFIILESLEDAEIYAKINAEIKSHQAINFWMGFKSQTFRQRPSDYYIHEEPQDNIMGAVLSIKLSFSQSPVSLVQYCSYSDNIISDMNSCIYKYINRGEFVRINAIGGYCPVKSLGGYKTVRDITEIEMFNFLLHKDTGYNFEIAGKHLVIENDKYIPKDLINLYCQKTGITTNEVQVFNSFKHRTILFKDSHFGELFRNGIRQGLENIVFETAAQDIPQIDKLKAVFEALMPQLPDKVLNIWVKIYPEKRHLIAAKAANIKINFL